MAKARGNWMGKHPSSYRSTQGGTGGYGSSNKPVNMGSLPLISPSYREAEERWAQEQQRKREEWDRRRAAPSSP